MENQIKQIDDACLENLIVPRFLKYVRYDTGSVDAEQTPSTPGQWELANALRGELSALGLTDGVSSTSQIITVPSVFALRRAANDGLIFWSFEELAVYMLGFYHIDESVWINFMYGDYQLVYLVGIDHRIQD